MKVENKNGNSLAGRWEFLIQIYQMQTLLIRIVDKFKNLFAHLC